MKKMYLLFILMIFLLSCSKSIEEITLLDYLSSEQNLIKDKISKELSFKAIDTINNAIERYKKEDNLDKYKLNSISWVLNNQKLLNKKSTFSLKQINYELPAEKPDDNIIRHRAYSISFNKSLIIPNWVAYEFTKDELNGDFSRTGLNFNPDPDCKYKQATDDDYYKSGYEKGHMANAEDMSWDFDVLKESFYYTNAIPQKKNLNTGRWKVAENKVRKWVENYDTLFVVSGGIINNNVKYIGKNKVGVPDEFYKVILVFTQKYQKGIGFIISQDSPKIPLEKFATSIDEVEKRTGIDFFYQLPDNIENKIEKSYNINDWIWK